MLLMPLIMLLMMFLIMMFLLLQLCILMLLEGLVGCLNLHPILRLIIVTKFHEHPSPISPNQVLPILFLPISLMPIYLLPTNPFVAQFVPT